jgi:hypothetical protein
MKKSLKDNKTIFDVHLFKKKNLFSDVLLTIKPEEFIIILIAINHILLYTKTGRSEIFRQLYPVCG